MTRGEGLGGYGSHVLHRMALHGTKFDVLTGFLGVVVGSAVESIGSALIWRAFCSHGLCVLTYVASAQL